jgi:hypothetical protein
MPRKNVTVVAAIVLALFFFAGTIMAMASDEDFEEGATAARAQWHTSNCSKATHSIKANKASRNEDFKDGWSAVEREIGLRQREISKAAVCEEVAADLRRTAH